MSNIITGILMLVSVTSYGQETALEPGAVSNVNPGQTQFYAEFGGPGIIFSANIDRRFKPGRTGFGFRAGVGFVNYTVEIPNQGWTNTENRSTYSIPLQVNYVFGKQNSPHMFEVGAGATYMGVKNDWYSSNPDNATQLMGSTSFMYRRAPEEGGFTWRIGFVPLVAKGNIYSFGAVGVGYSF